MKNETQPELMPKLRFREFEGEWSSKHFKNIFKFVRSNSFSRNDMSETNGNVLNIHYGDIHTKYKTNFDLTDEIVPSINSDIKLNFEDSDYLKEGDLVIADASEDYKDIGKAIEIINLEDKKVVSGLHTIVARPLNASQGFYGNLFKTYTVRKQLMRIANGISVLGISKSNLEGIELITSNYEEQQKIASFLTAVDKRIEQLTKKKKLLEEYKKGVMQKIFNQEIRFKDENGKDFPEWEEKQLIELVEIVKDKNHQNNNSLVLTNSALHGILSQEEYFDREIANSSNLTNYYIVKKDDFVYNPRISKLAPVGPISRNNYKTGVMSPLYSVFSPHEKMLDYLELYFKTSRWHKYMKTVANYGARHDRMNITQEDFYNLPIQVPRDLEIFKITKYMTENQSYIENVTNSLKILESFKKGLLQQMFI